MAQVDREKLLQLTRSRKRRLKLRETAQATGTLETIMPSQNGPPTEFEVQAFLYHELQRLGFVVRGELQSKCGTCRFDLMVFDPHGNPCRIIEVKKHKQSARLASPVKKPWRDVHRQVVRYAEFGCEVDLVCGLKAAKKYIDSVSSGARRLHGVEVSDCLTSEFLEIVR